MKKFILIPAIMLCCLINFKSHAQLIQAQTGYYINNSWYDWTEEWIKVDTTIISGWPCPGWNYSNNGALKIAVFDSLCQPWVSAGALSEYIGPYGEVHCTSYDTYAFDFYFSSDTDRTTVKNFINIIPLNDYVLVMTHQSNHCSLWSDSLIAAFQSIGSSITDSTRIDDNAPYIIFGRKGAAPGSMPEVIGMPYGNLIMMSDSLHCNPNSIAEINTDQNISVYPNPSSNTIYITVPEKSSIEILNIEGQIIKRTIACVNHVSIDIADLARGMYFIKINSKQSTSVKKFIKE